MRQAVPRYNLVLLQPFATAGKIATHQKRSPLVYPGCLIGDSVSKHKESDFTYSKFYTVKRQ